MDNHFLTTDLHGVSHGVTRLFSHTPTLPILPHPYRRLAGKGGGDGGRCDGATVRRYGGTRVRRYDGMTVRRYGGLSAKGIYLNSLLLKTHRVFSFSHGVSLSFQDLIFFFWKKFRRPCSYILLFQPGPFYPYPFAPS